MFFRSVFFLIVVSLCSCAHKPMNLTDERKNEYELVRDVEYNYDIGNKSQVCFYNKSVSKINIYQDEEVVGYLPSRKTFFCKTVEPKQYLFSIDSPDSSHFSSEMLDAKVGKTYFFCLIRPNGAGTPLTMKLAPKFMAEDDLEDFRRVDVK